MLGTGLDFVKGYPTMPFELSSRCFHMGYAPGQRIPFSDAEVRQAANRIRRKYGGTLATEYEPTGRTTREVQAIVGVTVDGDYGPKTKTAVAAKQGYLADLGYTPGKADGLWGTRTTRAWEAFMSELTQLIEGQRTITAAITAARQQIAALPAAITADILNYRNSKTPGGDVTVYALMRAAGNAANDGAPVDLPAITAAAETGAKRALDGIDLEVTAVKTNPKEQAV